MLRLLLDNTSHINIYSELEGAVYFANGDIFPDITTYHNIIENDRMMQDLAFTVDKDLDYESLVKSFLTQIYERKPARVVGSTIHSRFDLIHKIWPNARYIHLIRDPRDVARSCIGMGWVGNVYAGTEIWLEAEERWDKIVGDLNTNSYIELRYEDLVTDPTKELSEICAFLGVSFDERMLDIDKVSTYARPDPKYKEQWKHKLSDAEILSVECQCANLMLKRGYELNFKDQSDYPGTIKKIFYRVESRFKRILFNIDRYGFILWLSYVILKRLPFKALRQKTIAKKDDIDRTHLK